MSFVFPFFPFGIYIIFQFMILIRRLPIFLFHFHIFWKKTFSLFLKNVVSFLFISSYSFLAWLQPIKFFLRTSILPVICLPVYCDSALSGIIFVVPLPSISHYLLFFKSSLKSIHISFSLSVWRWVIRRGSNMYNRDLLQNTLNSCTVFRDNGMRNAISCKQIHCNRRSWFCALDNFRPLSKDIHYNEISCEIYVQSWP